MQYHVRNMTKRYFFNKDKTLTECTEKWSEYSTCKECEDEVNRKGHLTNLKREFMWKIFKMIFNTKLQCMREKCNEEKEIHQTSSAIPCA